MIGWTNVGSATTALSLGFAVIHVTAPIGSIISFSKSGVIVDVLSPDNSIVNTNDSTKSDWYYSVSSDNYGTWTVTATLDEDITDASVIVNTNKQYDVFLNYIFQLYNEGVIASAVGSFVTGYSSGVTPTRTYNTTNIYMKGSGNSSSGSNGSIVTNNAIDITHYKTLYVRLSAASFPTNTSFHFGVTAAKNNTFTSYEADKKGASANVDISLDISNITGYKYLGFGGSGNASLTWSFNLVKFWLK